MRATLVLLLGVSLAAHADSLTVAVASNFRATAEVLADDFAARTGHAVRISSGSTGKLHAQLQQGAPFDVLLAADADSPRLLEESGIGVAGSRFTYAVGVLVLWSAAEGAADCPQELERPGEFRLAMANPATAPYGRAAREFLTRAGLWETLGAQLVYGENVAQALHFAVSGNARYAFIAKAQAIDPRLPPASCLWLVPIDSYAPLTQQALLLRRAADKPAARAFLHYLQGDAARATIERSGFGVP